MTATVQRTRSISSETRRTLIAGLVVVAFTVFVCVESWAGSPITFNSILFWLIVGITYRVDLRGRGDAASSSRYTTSGIFNFAQGAIGMFLAFVYWELQVNWRRARRSSRWCSPCSSPRRSSGALIERLLMRRLADAPLVAQLVVTIGLMLALIGLAGVDLGPRRRARSTAFFGTERLQHRRHVHAVVPAHHDRRRRSRSRSVLRFLLYRTRLGVAMRAVVDNRDARRPERRPARAGVDVSWALGSSMAAIAGIFLAEELAHPRRRDAHAADRRRVRGGDHRPAEEPAADVHRRPDHRSRRSRSSRTS